MSNRQNNRDVKGKPKGKSVKQRQVSDSESESSESDKGSDSGSDSIHETLVMEVPIAEHKVKKLLKGRDASKNESLKPMPRDETHDVEHVCTNCPKYQKKLRELRSRLKGISAEDEPNSVALEIPAIDKQGKTIRFVNIPGRVCDWDTEPFDWEPTMLPHGMVGDKCRMSDYFCSAECAAAFNMYQLNDKDVWKRKTLIDRMESVRRGKSVVVKPASTPRLMKKFGGTHTPAEYRKLNGTGKRSYRPLPASVIPIVTVLESDQLGITRSDDSLVLKRETPLNNQSSLERSMRLRVSRKKDADSDDEDV
jgi:hypothetical protein